MPSDKVNRIWVYLYTLISLSILWLVFWNVVSDVRIIMAQNWHSQITLGYFISMLLNFSDFSEF